jgi:L-threonylcarbamoyladenylate synthase
LLETKRGRQALALALLCVLNSDWSTNLMPRVDLATATETLRRGGVVALPTETVYGLAADCENELAVRQIFALKARPASHPLIIHVDGLALASRYLKQRSSRLHLLARAFWPGPLTVVCEASAQASHAVTGGQPTVAIRVPAHDLTLSVIGQLGRGIAAPSANRFGAVSPTSAAHVETSLGADLALLDGGQCQVGIESTIIDLTDEQPRLLRPGAVTVAQLENVLNVEIGVASAKSTVRAPGMLASHYAPRAGLELVELEKLATRAQTLKAGQPRLVVLAPEGVELAADIAVIRVPSTAEGYAQVLYSALRQADALAASMILAPLPAGIGIGEAIVDRLTKAAAGKGNHS